MQDGELRYSDYYVCDGGGWCYGFYRFEGLKLVMYVSVLLGKGVGVKIFICWAY